MATQEQAEASVTRLFVALNAFDSLGLNYQAVIDFWAAAKANNQPLDEEAMRSLAASLL